jgi:hypothetical protein
LGDTIAKAGRRVGTNRDDTKPWAKQVVSVKQQADNSGIDTRPLENKIQQLQSENNRLRKGATAPDIDELVELLVPLVTERVRDEVKESLAETLIG